MSRFADAYAARRNLGRVSAPTIMPEQQDEETRFARSIAQRTWRGVAGAFEPLQLPQDVLFGVISGALDSNKSIADYFKDFDLRDYGMYGEIPERVNSGAGILELVGVEDSAFRRVAGFGLDIFADPLLLGGWLGAVGKVGTVAGLTRTGTKLQQVGRNFDDWAGLITTTRGGVKRGIPVAAGKAYNAVTPAPLREMVDTRLNAFMGTVLDTQIPGFAKSGATVESLVDVVGAGLQQRTTTLQRRFGRAAAQADAAGVGAGADTSRIGREVRQAEQTAELTGRQVRDVATTQTRRIYDVLGLEQQGMTQRVGSALLRMVRGTQRQAGKFSKSTQDILLSQVKSTADEYGSLMIGFDAINAPRLENIGIARQAQEGLEGLAESLRATGGLQRRDEVLENLQAVRREVGELAARNGDNPREVEQAFDELLSIVTETDAIIGYQLSMYEPIKRRFVGLFADAGYKADDLWGDMVRQISEGKSLSDITELRINAREAAAGVGEVKNLKIADILGEQTKTLDDALNTDEFFGLLDLEKYVIGLRDGHLRRSFAVFQDNRGIEQWFNSIKNGRVIPSSLMDEVEYADVLRQKGVSANVVERVQTYVEGVKNRTNTRQKYGTMIDARNLSDALLEAGVSKREVERVMDTLVGSVSGSPKYEQFVSKVRTQLERYRELPTENIKSGQGQRAFLAARKELPEETLELLGELTNPLVALAETAEFAGRTLPKSRYLQDFYQKMRQLGLVSDTPVPGVTTPIAYKETEALAGFSGKYVHPYVEKELRHIMRAPGNRVPNIIERVNNWVRSAFLSGPNIITQNISGGLLTSSFLGINAKTMSEEMVEILGELARRERDPSYKVRDLGDLNQYFPVDISRLSDANVIDSALADLRRRAAGIDRSTAPGFVEEVSDLFRRFLDNPIEAATGTPKAGRATRAGVAARGVGATLGLQGFQTSESVMKLAAFRAAKRQGFDPSEAAELARISTFDYSELPDMIRSLREWGLLLFPGFSYFILGRTVSGALRRPGVFAASDRIDAAVFDLQTDEDEKYALLASMPEWLREEGGIPFGMRENEAGDKIGRMLPGSQLLPMSFQRGGLMGALRPFTESAANLGLWQSWAELFSAFTTGEPEALFGARYGKKVFSEDATQIRKMAEGLAYVYNSMAPNFTKKMITYTPDDEFEGLAVSIFNSMVSMPDDTMALKYSSDEIMSGRIERNLLDTAVSTFGRSATPVAINGPMQNINRNYNGALASFNQSSRRRQERIRRAILENNRDLAERLYQEDMQARREFYETWQPLTEAIRQYQNGSQMTALTEEPVILRPPNQ